MYEIKITKYPKRGMTLIELMIAIMLSFIVISCVYSTYIWILKLNAQLSGEKDIISSSEVILGSLKKDIAQTNLNLATILYSPDSEGTVALCVPRGYDRDSQDFLTDPKTGMPQWKSLRIYYLMQGDTNIRVKDVFDIDASTLPIGEGDLQNYCNDGSGRLLEDKVQALGFELRTYNPDPDNNRNDDNQQKSNGTDKNNVISATPSPTPSPEEDKVGGLDVYLVLSYRRRNAKEDTLREFYQTVYSDNSIYNEPGPPHVIIPTPSPLASPPEVPKDWDKPF